jgi:hypothetical protein
MQEVLTESVRLVNLPFTVLLIGLLIYWLLVMLGLLHFDTGADADVQAGGDAGLDGGGGADAGAAVDGPADLGAHTDLAADGSVSSDAGGDLAGDAHAAEGADHGDAAEGHGAGFLASVFRFVNLGDVPAMIVVSLQALCMWVFAMIANHYWNDDSLVRGLVSVVPNVLLSAVFTRYLTWPMARFFRALNREYDEHRPLVGRTCVVLTSEVNDQFGQAQIATRGAPVVINARTTEPVPLRKGDTGLVVREDKARHVFFIRRVTPDQLEV